MVYLRSCIFAVQSTGFSAEDFLISFFVYQTMDVESRRVTLRSVPHLRPPLAWNARNGLRIENI